MFFQSKIDRVVKTKELDEQETESRIELEKGDLKAMFLAALITFLPAILLVSLMFVFVAYVMFF